MPNKSVVLIVEDNEDIVRSTALRLRAAGFEPISACDGNEGMASAIEHRPDAIVMDVRMPVKDGLTALAELRSRADTMTIPVVMLSGSIADQETALDAGASFFIRKPYDGAQLIKAVTAAIARPATCDRNTLTCSGDKIAWHSAEQIHTTMLQPTTSGLVRP